MLLFIGHPFPSYTKIATDTWQYQTPEQDLLVTHRLWEILQCKRQMGLDGQRLEESIPTQDKQRIKHRDSLHQVLSDKL